MPIAYWSVLIAALLPPLLAIVAKAGGGVNNHHPRDEISRLPPLRRRAYAAHLNACENFPFFAAAVIIAVTQRAPAAIIDWLAVLYIALRVAHAALYIADQATLRSTVFLAGYLVNVAILVLPAFG
jgi:uncharacterized MAPEG superfamily protein